MSGWHPYFTTTNEASPDQSHLWTLPQEGQFEQLRYDAYGQSNDGGYDFQHAMHMNSNSSIVSPEQLEWRTVSPLPQPPQYPAYSANSQLISYDSSPYNFANDGTYDFLTRGNYNREGSSTERQTTDSSRSENLAEESGQDEPYNKLLERCFKSSPHCEMQLKDIYQWFRENTEKRHHIKENGWQNSIRHNLSMNPAFVRGSRSNSNNHKKNMWHLSKHARDCGIEPTTRFRKHERSSYKKAINRTPALQRQISGARGGRAARRAAARSRSMIGSPTKSQYLPTTPSISPSPYPGYLTVSSNVESQKSCYHPLGLTCPSLLDTPPMGPTQSLCHQTRLEPQPPIDPTLTNPELTAIPGSGDDFFTEAFENESIKDDFHLDFDYGQAPTGLVGYGRIGSTAHDDTYAPVQQQDYAIPCAILTKNGIESLGAKELLSVDVGDESIEESTTSKQSFWPSSGKHMV